MQFIKSKNVRRLYFTFRSVLSFFEYGRPATVLQVFFLLLFPYHWRRYSFWLKTPKPECSQHLDIDLRPPTSLLEILLKRLLLSSLDWPPKPLRLFPHTVPEAPLLLREAAVSTTEYSSSMTDTVSRYFSSFLVTITIGTYIPLRLAHQAAPWLIPPHQ